MKVSLALSISLCLAASAAQAVKFNPEAMRTMRAEGEKIAEQALKPRTFRLASGLCLQPGEGGNVIAVTCQKDRKAQIWSFDEQGRVVHNGGLCLAAAGKPDAPGTNVVTRQCGNSAEFKWRPNANDQLVSGGTACLQVVGDVNKSGANVNIGACKVGPNQVWK
jgi:hypothetical protein